MVPVLVLTLFGGSIFLRFCTVCCHKIPRVLGEYEYHPRKGKYSRVQLKFCDQRSLLLEMLCYHGSRYNWHLEVVLIQKPRSPDDTNFQLCIGFNERCVFTRNLIYMNTVCGLVN